MRITEPFDRDRNSRSAVIDGENVPAGRALYRRGLSLDSGVLANKKSASTISATRMRVDRIEFSVGTTVHSPNCGLKIPYRRLHYTNGKKRKISLRIWLGADSRCEGGSYQEKDGSKRRIVVVSLKRHFSVAARLSPSALELL